MSAGVIPTSAGNYSGSGEASVALDCPAYSSSSKSLSVSSSESVSVPSTTGDEAGTVRSQGVPGLRTDGNTYQQLSGPTAP